MSNWHRGLVLDQSYVYQTLKRDANSKSISRMVAPMILDEYMDQLFSLDRPEPFMTVVYPVTKDYDSSIAISFI